jgi:hypothetical protein
MLVTPSHAAAGAARNLQREIDSSSVRGFTRDRPRADYTRASIVPRRSVMKTFIAVLSLIFALAAFTSMLSLSGQGDPMQRVSAYNAAARH